MGLFPWGILECRCLLYLPLGISPVLQTHQNLGCPVFTALQAETVLVIIELNWTHLAVVSVVWNTHGKGGLSGEALARNARDPGSPHWKHSLREYNNFASGTRLAGKFKICWLNYIVLNKFGCQFYLKNCPIEGSVSQLALPCLFCDIHTPVLILCLFLL